MRAWALALGLLSGLWASSAQASTTLWGYGGLVSVPDARVLAVREVELGVTAYTSPIVLSAPTPAGLAVLGFARAGVLNGLEASLAYGLPGTPWPVFSWKYQLWHASATNGLALALGMLGLGAASGPQLPGPQYFLVASQTWPQLTAHLGFAGDASLNARLLLGLELPLPGAARLLVDAQGPQDGHGPAANLGVEWHPLSPLRVMLASAGSYDRPLYERSFDMEAGARFMIPEAPLPPAAPSPAPSASPGLPKSSAGGPAARPPHGALLPPALPAATLIARIVGKSGEPLGGYQVRLAPLNLVGKTTPAGYCFFGGLALGHYHLGVLDPAGAAAADVDVELRETGPTPLTVPIGQVSVTPVGRAVLSGTLSDPTAHPLPDARILVNGPGMSLIATSDAAGRYRIVDLPPGTYKLTLQGKGHLEGAGTVQVATGSATTLDLTLRRSAP